MDTYVYAIGNSLYFNLTNKCTNKCSFCIRETASGTEDNNLWLDKEPTVEDLLQALPDLRKYRELVFCGFGEPLMRLDLVVELAKILKPKGLPIRLNTNGQANLIHGRNIVPDLKDLIDIISISLNAENNEIYQQLCAPIYGTKAYPAIIDFIKKSKDVIPRVILSVVDLPEVDKAQCAHLAEQLGVELRIRQWSANL